MRCLKAGSTKERSFRKWEGIKAEMQPALHPNWFPEIEKAKRRLVQLPA